MKLLLFLIFGPLLMALTACDVPSSTKPQRVCVRGHDEMRFDILTGHNSYFICDEYIL